jgi:hypothetical protein
MQQALSRAAVIVLVVYALFSVYTAASPFWAPAGTLGILTDYGATVRGVAPGGPAARAGIVPGDRMQLAATPIGERRYLAGAGIDVPPGMVVRFPLRHEGRIRDVTLTSVPVVMGRAERFSLLVQCLASLVFIIVGAGLIWLRPGTATWGFGLYCLLILPSDAYPARLESTFWSLASTFFYDIVQNIGVAGLLVFTLEFPRPFPGVWRTRVRRALPAGVAVLALMTLYPDVANTLLGIGAHLENVVLQLLFGACFVLAVAILWDTYRRVAIDERERMRWVLIGFIFGLLINYVGSTLIYSALVAFVPPAWFGTLLFSLNVLLPLAVAHAVVRHRVLDIDFVIGRALVFAILTLLLAGAFGVLDWFFGSVLEGFEFTRIVQAALSIAVAFAIGRIEEFTLKAVEVLFFRKRRAAEAHLDRIIRVLSHAPSREMIEDALIREAAGTLELTAAAVYRRTDDDTGYALLAASGTATAAPADLGDADRLVSELRAADRVVDLDLLGEPRSAASGGANAFTLAVPMFANAALTGFVLYGAHTDGATIDSDEAAQLERLADAASLAFEQLEAKQLRADNAQLRLKLESLGRIHGT